MEHKITIVIHSDIDPSELLEIAQQAGHQIADNIENYHDTIADFFDDDVTVETK